MRPPLRAGVDGVPVGPLVRRQDATGAAQGECGAWHLAAVRMDYVTDTIHLDARSASRSAHRHYHRRNRTEIADGTSRTPAQGRVLESGSEGTRWPRPHTLAGAIG